MNVPTITPRASRSRGPMPIGLRLCSRDIPIRLTDPRLVAAARRLYAVRQQRNVALGMNLFFDPAWDMLLDLFITEGEHRWLSVSALCIGSGAPAATALRYLALLQKRGLAERLRDDQDARRSFVRLSDSAWAAMEDLLSKT